MMWNRCCWLLLGLVLVGCGNSEQLVPVKGQVLIDGQVLKKGAVRFLSPNKKSASGQINDQGEFQLTTNQLNDGCFVGDYQIEVIAYEPVGAASQRWLVPKEYNSNLTSGLKQTISGPMTDLKVELTWKKSAAGHTKPYVDGGSKE
jgi:hypothetical protein